jgi:hypothetical protein
MFESLGPLGRRSDGAGAGADSSAVWQAFIQIATTGRLSEYVDLRF